MFLSIDPVALEIGALKVHWYGLILGTAALVGLLLAIWEGKRYQIKSDFFMDLLLIGAPSAIIAARIYYVAFEWGEYKDNPLEVFAIWQGGIAIYGALIGALAAAVWYCRKKGYPFWRIADICAPSLLAGQMIGRWGNFINQEAYGGPVKESFLRDDLNLPGFIVDHMFIQGEFHHPTFLYESLWSLVGIGILLVLRRQRFMRSGELLASYFIWYSIGRFFIEALRTDSLTFTGPEWLASVVDALWTPMDAFFGFDQGAMAKGNIRISQLLAVLIVIAAVAFIIVRRRKGYAQERYLDPIVNAYAVSDAANGELGVQADEDSAERNGAYTHSAEPDGGEGDSKDGPSVDEPAVEQGADTQEADDSEPEDGTEQQAGAETDSGKSKE